MARTLVLIAAAATLIAWGLDLDGWRRGDVSAEGASRALRVLRTMLCAAVPWVRPGETADRRAVGSALAVCAAADVLLVGLRAFLPGVALFGIAQALLLRRAAVGVDLRGPAARRAAAAALAGWALLLLALSPGLAARGLVAPVGAYGVVMLGSVGVATLAWWTGARPGAEGRALAIGMALFAVTDVMVGVGASWPDDPAARLVRLHTGWVYTPALGLLAWSVRRAPGPGAG
jgi:uncharacterized membrane protein YhhN